MFWNSEKLYWCLSLHGKIPAPLSLTSHISPASLISNSSALSTLKNNHHHQNLGKVTHAKLQLPQLGCSLWHRFLLPSQIQATEPTWRSEPRRSLKLTMYKCICRMEALISLKLWFPLKFIWVRGNCQFDLLSYITNMISYFLKIIIIIKYLQGINNLLIQSCYTLTNMHKLVEDSKCYF